MIFAFWKIEKRFQKAETLNRRLALEDSFDFYDSVCVLIVLTRSIIWDTLHVFHFLKSGMGWGAFRKSKIENPKIKTKTETHWGNLREGREALPRRCLHPLRFCFCFRFDLRWIWFYDESLLNYLGTPSSLNAIDGYKIDTAIWLFKCNWELLIALKKLSLFKCSQELSTAIEKA